MRHIIAALILVAGLVLQAWADEVVALRRPAERGHAETHFALGSLYREATPADLSKARGRVADWSAKHAN